MSIIRFDFTSGAITTNDEAIKHKIFFVDDERQLYVAEVEGVSVLTLVSNSTALSEDIYMRSVSVMGREFEIVYRHFLEISLESYEPGVFFVAKWTWDGARGLGALRICDNEIKFDDEVVDASKLRSLYARCLVLRG